MGLQIWLQIRLQYRLQIRLHSSKKGCGTLGTVQCVCVCVCACACAYDACEKFKVYYCCTETETPRCLPAVEEKSTGTTERP